MTTICSTCRKHFLGHSSFMTYHRFVTRLTRQMSLVEQELFTPQEHLSSPPVPFTRSLVLWCVVCPFVLFSSLLFFDIRILITFCIFKLFLLCLSQFVMLNHKFTVRGNDMDITCTRTTKERGTIYKERSIKHLSSCCLIFNPNFTFKW
jgi:hypothetical protein